MAQKKFRERGRIVSNEQVAQDTWCMSVRAPLTARFAEPGQFVQTCVPDFPAQMLRIPLAVYDASASKDTVDICYQVVGEGTRQLSGLTQGGELDVVGPLGCGWSWPDGAKRALLVSGGVGAPALNMLAHRLAAAEVRVDAVMGFASAGRICCVEHLREAAQACGGTIEIATDDGSYGTPGFVTELSNAKIASGDYDYVAVCGPVPMMRNVVKPALEHGVTCQVSMEKLMACGIGACLSCVVDTVGGRKRCCADGPVFDAAEVVW